MTWTVHPLVQEPWPRSLALMAAIAAFAAVAAVGMGGAGYAVISVVVLCASLSRYWLPTHYGLDDTGVWVEHLGQRRCWAWRDLRRWQRVRGGVVLSPLARNSRLDAFRGAYLRCGDRQAEVVEFVAQRLPR